MPSPDAMLPVAFLVGNATEAFAAKRDNAGSFHHCFSFACCSAGDNWMAPVRTDQNIMCRVSMENYNILSE